MWDLFDTRAYLVADDDTLRQRLAARTTNDYGQTADELQTVLAWNAVLEQHYLDRGAVIIDATRPLAEVVDADLRVGRS